MTEIIRMLQLTEKTCISRAHIYALLSRGEFPRPIRLGRRAVGWRVDDIETWLASRPEAGRW